MEYKFLHDSAPAFPQKIRSSQNETACIPTAIPVYRHMCEELEGAGRRADGISSFLTFVSVYKNEDCLLTDGRFARQINLDTGIADMSSGAITREMMAMYTCLFPKIICMILIE